MLIEMNGVSIGAEPRKDGRFQGYILLESGRQYFYGESKQAVAQQIVKALRDPQTTKKRRKTKRKETLNEWLDTWIRLYKQPNLKPSSLATLRYALLPARNTFGTRALDSITADELQTFLLGMDRPRSRDECRNALAAAYRKAVALGKIRLSPTDALEIKRHKRAHRSGLTNEQQAAFLAAAKGTKYETLYRFLLGTGLRIGEALALLPSDFADGYVTVSKDIVLVNGKPVEQNTPKTAAGNRTVPVPKAVWALTSNLTSNVPNDQRVFNYNYAAVRTSLRRLSEKLGFAVSAHILRHTYSDRLEESGISPKIKQYLLGHATLDMTQNVYTEIHHDFLDRESDKIRDAFSLI